MRNNYESSGNKVIIYLNSKKENRIFECIIDKSDFKTTDNYDVMWYPKWQAKPKNYYVSASQYLGLDDNNKPKYKTLYLSRILVEANRDDWVDHKDHNPMNNSRKNLRKTNKTNNSRNRIKSNSNNKSTGHRNVSWISGYWRIQLQIQGKNKMLKEKFDDVDEAGKFAEKMRKKYYGEYEGKN